MAHRWTLTMRNLGAVLDQYLERGAEDLEVYARKGWFAAGWILEDDQEPVSDGLDGQPAEQEARRPREGWFGVARMLEDDNEGVRSENDRKDLDDTNGEEGEDEQRVY